MSSWWLLAVVSISVMAVFLWPMLRSYLQTGRSALVGHNSRDPVHQIVGISVSLLLLLGLAYAVLYGIFGPEHFLGPPIGGARSGVGLLMLALGLSIMALAQAQMGQSWRIGVNEADKTDLVSAGLYRYVRHPIYSGFLMWLAGLCLFAPTPLLSLAAGLLLWGVSIQTRLEERHMVALHGESYRAQMEGRGRLLPFFERQIADLPPRPYIALSLLLYLVALLDVLQVLWRPWVPKHAGALLGALLYGSLSLLAARGHRIAAIVPVFVPILPVSILVLSALGVSVGVAPDVPMVVILVVQLLAAALGGSLARGHHGSR